MRQPLHEQEPVRQFREHVVIGEIVQAFLRLHAVGDVLAGRDEMGNVTVGVLERRDGLFLVIERAVFAAIDQHVLEHIAPQDRAPQAGVESVSWRPDLTRLDFLPMASAGEKPVMASKEGLMYSMMPLRSVIITVAAACSMARDSLSACFSMRVRSSISFSSLALERTRWRASDSAREVCLASVDK